MVIVSAPVAYAYLADRYALLASGSSMGDQYGPTLVTREPTTLDQLRGRVIAIPGRLTTAYLTLQLCLGKDAPVWGLRFTPDARTLRTLLLLLSGYIGYAGLGDTTASSGATTANSK